MKKNFKRLMYAQESPKKIFDSLDFYGNGSSFCLSGQKSLKSLKLEFAPKQGLIWTSEPDGSPFPTGGHLKVSLVKYCFKFHVYWSIHP